MLTSLREAEQGMSEKRRGASGQVKGTSLAPKATKLSLEDQIETLISDYVEAIEKGKVRVTVADLIRLRKLRDELSPKKTIVPEVTWIDGWERPAVRHPRKT